MSKQAISAEPLNFKENSQKSSNEAVLLSSLKENANNPTETAYLREEAEKDSDLLNFPSNYETKVKIFDISPQTTVQLESLRTMSVSGDFQKLALFVATLQADFPINKGRLLAIIDPTLIAPKVPDCEIPQDIPEDLIQQSKQNIEIHDTMAYISSIPVWDRLPGERYDFYILFKVYRDMRYSMLDTEECIISCRSMAAVSRRLKIDGRLVGVLSKIYNWATRCAYFDYYMESELNKRKMHEMQLLQSDHLKLSKSLIQKATAYIEAKINLFSPKEILDMLELSLRFARLSLNMPADKPFGAAASSSMPTLAIYNSTTNNSAEQLLAINAPLGSNHQNFSSDAERQLHENIKEDVNILSILHVLQKSGAMNSVLKEGTVVVDVECEEVPNE